MKVDFPTPPLPERIRSLCATVDIRAVIAGRSGSGPLGAVAQMVWFGQPAQASILPACWLSGPGQFSGRRVSWVEGLREVRSCTRLGRGELWSCLGRQREVGHRGLLEDDYHCCCGDCGLYSTVVCAVCVVGFLVAVRVVGWRGWILIISRANSHPTPRRSFEIPLAYCPQVDVIDI